MVALSIFSSQLNEINTSSMNNLVNLNDNGYTLILGGQRSGKSEFAEKLIEIAGGGWYIATSENIDKEMTLRIKAHQDRRGDNWQTIEEPVLLVQTLLSLDGQTKPVLVDCLTLWLTNIMLLEKNIEAEVADLCALKKKLTFPVIFVSNEVGQGVIPENVLGRQFIDLAGQMNQKIAYISDNVIFVTAGIPTILK